MSDLFLSQTQHEAIAFLDRCATALEPLAAVSGASGTGKTVALNVLLARRESSGDRVIRVHNFVAGPLSLHRFIAAALGVQQAAELSPDELEPALRRILIESGDSEPPILAIDDAQSLLPETLRYLSLLGGLKEGGRPLFRILLVGRTGFTVRQPVALHHAVEPMRPEDARQVANHGFAATGVRATEPMLEDVVRQSQGNLRRLEAALRTAIRDVPERDRRRLAAVPSRSQVPERNVSRRRSSSRSGRSRRLAAPLVIAAVVLAGGVAYHEGLLPATGGAKPGTPKPAAPISSNPTPGSPAPGSPAPGNSAPSSPVPGSSPSGVTSPAAPRGQSAPASAAAAGGGPAAAPPAPGAGAAVLAQASGPNASAPPASSPTGSPSSGSPQLQAPPPPPPLPAAGPPAPAASAAHPASPAAPSPATPSPTASSSTGSSSAASSSAGAAPSASVASATHPGAAPAVRPSAASPPPAPDRTPNMAGAAAPAPASIDLPRYRLYNVGACHHGVCPRWSVTDLARHNRFVASFDLGGLHLDRTTEQRLREGTLDLMVTGWLVPGGGEGHKLVAAHLISVLPHHGRVHAPASAEGDAAYQGGGSPAAGDMSGQSSPAAEDAGQVPDGQAPDGQAPNSRAPDSQASGAQAPDGAPGAAGASRSAAGDPGNRDADGGADSGGTAGNTESGRVITQSPPPGYLSLPPHR